MSRVLFVASAGLAAALAFVSPARAQEGDPAGAPSPSPSSTAASAPTSVATSSSKAACVAALDRAQSLQSARKLREARASYLACAADACPDLVREDCTRSLVDLDAMTPSFTFSAREGGHDVNDARVLLDGEAVANALDGHPVSVDPGNHVARFERAGGGVVELRLVAREGEKNRPVTGVFAAPVATRPLTRAEGSRFPVLPVVIGSAGLVTIGTSFVLRANASSDADALRASCAPTCDVSARDSLSDKLVVANVALGVGIGAVALAAATWLFDTRH